MIQFRVSSESKAELTERAQSAGLSVSAYIYEVLWPDSPPEKPVEPNAVKADASDDQIEAEARRIFNREGQTMHVARRIARERLS